MSLCGGFYSEKTTMHIQDPDLMSDGMRKLLPCYPSNVIYGHAASRGLDINRFSFGLDTGCVRSLVLSSPAHTEFSAQAHGQKLTAMILGPNPLRTEEWEEGDGDSVGQRGDFKFQGNGEAYDNNNDMLGETVFTKDSHSLKQARTIQFGEHGTAKLVHVSCS